MNESVVVLVQARVSSTRLPGKVLLPIAGRPMLWHVMTRARAITRADQVLLCTTTEPEDDELALLAGEYGWACARGSRDDVLWRLTGAAQAFGAALVVRVTADCPLLDPFLADLLICEYQRSGVGLLTNSPTTETGWPDGLDVEVCQLADLQAANREASDPTDREHVTPWIRRHRTLRYHHAPRMARNLFRSFTAAQLMWSVDTPAQLEHVRQLHGALARPDAYAWTDTMNALTALTRRRATG